MATHSSILAWRIPWTEEPGGLQSVESQRVGRNCARSRTYWESCPQNPDSGSRSSHAWHCQSVSSAVARLCLISTSPPGERSLPQPSAPLSQLALSPQSAGFPSCSLFLPLRFCSSIKSWPWSSLQGQLTALCSLAVLNVHRTCMAEPQSSLISVVHLICTL